MKRFSAFILALVIALSIPFGLSYAQQTIEIRDIVSILAYEDLLKLNDMIDEYLIQKSGKTAFEIKIDSMSYDELVKLKDSLTLAMWNSKEWQEVEVPVGVWKIGEDIPTGKWNISVPENAPLTWASYVYCDELDKTGLDAGNMFTCDIYYSGTLDRADKADGSDPTSLDIDFADGTYFIVRRGTILFTPAVGKPKLGFN